MNKQYYMLNVDYKAKTAYVCGCNWRLIDKAVKEIGGRIQSDEQIFEVNGTLYARDKAVLVKKCEQIKMQWRRNYLIAILDHYCAQHKFRTKVDISSSGSIYYTYYLYDRTLIKIRIADHPPKGNCAHIYLYVNEDLEKPNHKIRETLFRSLQSIEKKVKRRSRDYLLLKLNSTPKGSE